MSPHIMSAEQPRSTPTTTGNPIDVPITRDPPLDDACSADEADGSAAASEPPGGPAEQDVCEQDVCEQDVCERDVCERAIRAAVRAAANSQGYLSGQIGVLITDDPTIHTINRRHLDHDYPTDVISFAYHRSDDAVEGELVVSRCTARRWAARIGCDWHSELLLYVIHGTLHVCGLDDATAEQQQRMRTAERAVLTQLKIPDAKRLERAFVAERRAEGETRWS